MAVTAVVAAAPTVAERLEVVRGRIAAAGGSSSAVTVVAVTKGFGPEAVAAALDAGVADVGESYAQEMAAKVGALGAADAGRAEAGPCRWHFLGHVQRNKVRRLAPAVHLWQAVDRLSAGAEIARWSPAAQVLVQVNVSGDPAKHGCRPEDVGALVEALAGLGLQVRGLMAVGPSGPPEAAREGFRSLARQADRLGLTERSMGMSDDLEVAVQEGSTMVRLGRALFGSRPSAPGPRR